MADARRRDKNAGVWVSLDGRVVRGRSARISVFDRGFLYGDSVYEVLRAYGGVPSASPFAFTAHLRRLRASAAGIGFELPRSDAWMVRALRLLLEQWQLGDGPGEPGLPAHAPSGRSRRDAYVRIVVTRGEGAIGLDPALAEHPRVLFYASAAHPPPPRAYREGVGARLVDDAAHARAVDPKVKSGNYLSNVLATQAARALGAHEALRVSGEGFVSEGASSNVFVVARGALWTPPLGAGILEGVTRAEVLALAGRLGLGAREAPLPAAGLLDAREVFITSSIREILPVTRLFDGRAGAVADERRVGDGRPGPVTRQLREAFRRQARRSAAREWAALCGAAPGRRPRG